MADLDPSLVYVTKTLRCSPERLVSGLMTINVRHEMVGTVSDVGEVDCNWAYNQRWGDDPNNVDAHTDYPYNGEKPEYATTFQRQYTDYTDDSGSATSFTDASCDTTDESTQVDHIANGNIVEGLEVSGTGITAGTTISSISSTTRFQLSADATATNTDETLTFSGPLTSLTQRDRTLSIGDFDCFLYYVTACAHLEDAYHPNNGDRVAHDPGGGSVYYYTRLPADKCQSFVKSHLISRINNAAETDDGDGLEMWKRGALRQEWGIAASDVAIVSPTETATITPYPWLVTNGVYDNSNNFGNNLALGEGNNTFFTPVFNISIGATHSGATASLADIGEDNTDAGSAGNGSTRWYPPTITHDRTYWDLQVKIGLWAYLETSKYAYFKNRINVFWQPFGETTEIELQ